MKRGFAFASFLAALLILPGCMWRGFTAETTTTQLTPHVGQSAIDVQTTNGNVEIVGDSTRKDVEVTAVVRASGSTQEEADARLAATTVSVTRDSAGTLVIHPVWPEPTQANDCASFTIHVPDARGVVVDSSNGTVIVSNLGGTLRIGSSNGEVKVTNHEGDATIHTSNGAVRVTDLDGSLDADTSNGSVVAMGVGGGAIISSSNGGINLSLADDSAGPIRLNTSNGNIDVQVGPAFSGRVVFETSNGKVSLRDAVGSRILQQTFADEDGGFVIVGPPGSGAESRVDTSNGHITFTIE